LQVLLIDPRQAKRAPGRPKTDRLDCQWLQRLHTYGLLAAAFRPADQICVLRSYLRHRQMLLTYGAHHIQHMHKALQQMNLKLSQVVSDITGATGMAILKAIIAGERDPLTLAKLRNPHCQHGEDDIAKALQGTWRAEHLFACKYSVIPSFPSEKTGLSKKSWYNVAHGKYSATTDLHLRACAGERQ
jgi:transposase